MSRLAISVLGFAALLLEPALVATGQQPPSPMLLVVHQRTQLYEADDREAPAERLRSGTLLVGTSRDISAVDQPLWRVHTTKSPRRSGFVRASAVTPWDAMGSEIKARAVALRTEQPEVGKLPELILLERNPAVRQAWKEVAQAVRENQELPKTQRLPEPYFARAEIWASVNNYAAALQDYLTAIEYARTAGRDLATYSAYFDKLHEVAGKLQSAPASAAKGAHPNFPDAALDHYARGYSEFFQDNTRVALERFDSAVQLSPDEPLYWYFRALAYRRLGDGQRAQHDALMGAYFEQQQAPFRGRALSKSLERVQGRSRLWLESFRLGDPASRILRSFNAGGETAARAYP